jgi:hypothetical protein
MDTNDYLNAVEKQSKHMLWCVRMLRKGRKLRKFNWYPGGHIKINKDGALVFVGYNGVESPSKIQNARYTLLPRENPHKVGTWKWARWEAKHNGAVYFGRAMGGGVAGVNFLDSSYYFSVSAILAKDWYVMPALPR